MDYAKAKPPIVVGVVLAIIFVFPIRAGAWSSKGHWITAYVAYRNLRPVARNRVDKLLRQHPDYGRWKASVLPGTSSGRTILSSPKNLAIFVRASTWADDIKGDPRFYNDGEAPTPLLPGYVSMERHSNWHFIQIPLSVDGIPTPAAADFSTVDQLVRMKFELSSGDELVKAYNLPWLIHLVSDLHQPLHCVTRFTRAHGPPLGDLGGNAFRIRNGSQTTNLHLYWDALPPETFVESTVSYWMKQFKPAQFQAPDPRVWVTESEKLAEEFVYTVGRDRPGEAPPKLTSRYIATAKEKAKERLVIAGFRLADMLNEQFKE